jgi:hypothetical protein
MKKIVLIYLFCISFSYSQVGIGTATPQKDLHVAGSSPTTVGSTTVRIEKLNSTNSPTLNDGTKLAPVYVDKDGELTLEPSGFTASGGNTSLLAPLNFLINVPNFIPDGALANGTVINNDLTTTTATALVQSVPFTATQASLIEVKFGITINLGSSDLNTPPSFNFGDLSAREFQIYFYIDLNNDGLDAAELSKVYGNTGQSYASLNQGITGYAYMNGMGYASIPAGNHSLKFYGSTIDGTNRYTSVGFGGDKDYLKIRLYN